MALADTIYRLRSGANMSEERFGEIVGVSQQAVHKWESGDSVPEISKLIKISKYFGVSLDSLVLGRNDRENEILSQSKRPVANYANLGYWGFYPSYIMKEYKQSIEEGLDIEAYKDLFVAVSKLPINETKKKLGDVLFDIVINAPLREDFKYNEPSSLDEIKALRKPYSYKKQKTGVTEAQVYGAWMGRIAGCMLGKTVENIKSYELVPFLKESGNYPMHRYIYSTDVTKETIEKYEFGFEVRDYIDKFDYMPKDDDTNYVVIAQTVIDKYGRDFTPFDMSRAWLELQCKDQYCTAEKVAYCNFIQGYEPPHSAIYKNPYREWIGAQIRGDYFGYINPGNPELAADMAWRDASISHVKNGIYGEMFISAMLAVAAETNDIEAIILAGLAEIPATSRLYESINEVLSDFKNGVSKKAVFDKIHARYDENDEHDWCLTTTNAMVVVASLLYGEGDFAKSICLAVETAFDTDCNGATVGSILGMANGIESIPEYWTKPFNDTLETPIMGLGKVKISDRVKITMQHIK